MVETVTLAFQSVAGDSSLNRWISHALGAVAEMVALGFSGLY